MWWCMQSNLRDIGSSNHNIASLNHSSLSACPSWRQILQQWLSVCPLSAISLQLPFCTLMLDTLEDKHKTRKLTSSDWRWTAADYVKNVESGRVIEKWKHKCTQWSWLNTKWEIWLTNFFGFLSSNFHKIIILTNQGISSIQTFFVFLGGHVHRKIESKLYSNETTIYRNFGSRDSMRDDPNVGIKCQSTRLNRFDRDFSALCNLIRSLTFDMGPKTSKLIFM